MKRGIKNFLESFIFIIILLVLVQTFLEDFAVLMGWSWDVRRILIVSGFFFDLFFTVEFLFRLYYALARREGREYLLHGKGWIDFIAAVPLLMFNSGPAMLAVAGGSLGVAGMGGMLNVLKTVKVVRIARVLRLLRVLKIFKQIKFVNAPMAQRHVSRIVSTVVTAMILPVIILNLVFTLASVRDAGQNYENRVEYLGNFLENQEPSIVWDYCQAEKAFLVVRQEGETIFSRYTDEDYKAYFGPGDYTYHTVGEYEIFMDARPLTADTARTNLTFFLMVVFVIAVLLIFYSPHFALTVTDPIIVMRKGLQETTYNLEVRIPRRYAGDDVYQLAGAYNNTFLPLKARNAGESEEMADLKVDDFDDLFADLKAEASEMIPEGMASQDTDEPAAGGSPGAAPVEVPGGEDQPEDEAGDAGGSDQEESDIDLDFDLDLDLEEEVVGGEEASQGDAEAEEAAESGEDIAPEGTADSDEDGELDLDLDDEDLLAELDEDLEKDLDKEKDQDADQDKG